jgi:hypothetical protein
MSEVQQQQIKCSTTTTRSKENLTNVVLEGFRSTSGDIFWFRRSTLLPFLESLSGNIKTRQDKTRQDKTRQDKTSTAGIRPHQE